MPQDLTVDSVSYRYPSGSRDALHHVSAEFAAGSCTAIMGATEAGKSTLLQALTGVIGELDGGVLSGRIRYGAADLADYRVQTLTQYIGLVLQDPASQIIGRTVGEDVAFGPRNHLVPRAEISRRVAQMLELVGLSGFEARSTAELSGGELQRLAIAGVLAMGPEVLCLDEATAELDPVGAGRLREVVASLRQRGMTVVTAEHDPAAVLDQASGIVVLDAGQVAWRGAPADFFADPDCVERLGIRPLPMSVVAREMLRDRPELALTLPVGRRLPITVAEMSGWLRDLLPADSRPEPQAPSAHGTDRPVIEIDDLHFGYSPRAEVLHGIHLTIRAGEFVALTGPNGAGKTTVAKHLNGLLRPTAGRVLICGRDVSGRPTWQLAGQVGYVFQNPDHQIFCRSVADEVGFALRVAGRPQAEISARTTAVLQFTGLTDLCEANPLTLTRGQRQLVAMASTLIAEPEILVIDEPTTGQDWRGVQAIMDLVDRLNQQGTTIVMISHDRELIAHHARRVVTIDGGRVVADGPVQTQVTTQLGELWQQCFGGRPDSCDEITAGRRLAQSCGART